MRKSVLRATGLMLTLAWLHQPAAAETFLQQYYGGGVHYHGLMGLGPAHTVIDMIKRYEAAGVTDLCIRLVGDDQVSQLEQFIHEVVPACMT